MPRPYTIAGLAAAAGVQLETIRYYQRLKLVPEPLRPIGSIRRYTEADADRLRFIKRAQPAQLSVVSAPSLSGHTTLAARAAARMEHRYFQWRYRCAVKRRSGMPSMWKKMRCSQALWPRPPM